MARHAYSDFHPDDPNRIKWDAMQGDLRALHLTLMNYALTRGYSYTRWQQVSNAMLFKEEGNIKIHRTRVIHLYEADYNLAIGLQWRSALYESEEHRRLNQGQYGSRPHRNAHDPIFIEEFQFEISRTTRKSLLQTNYDATSCYDRIIPNLAAIVSRKFGVPESVVLSNVTTLMKAKYRLKTELGTSTEFYQHDSDFPIYGTGQGSGNSPMIWCFLSSVLFDCYETKAHGATYELPDRSATTTIYMVGYVDDSNGQTNKFQDNDQPDDSVILEQASQDAQVWHDVLTASGGALELPKCSYHLLSWTFAANGTPFLKLDVPHTMVTVTNTAGAADPQVIPAISAHAAHKTLGHYKDPAGNQAQQLRELTEKCDKAADFIATSPLNRSEAWTYYFAIFLTSVGYPLASCYFSAKVLEKVQRRAMSNIVAKCGYNRHTKREVIYGPGIYGGASFRTLYSLQGTGQIMAFLKYWRSPCQAGQLLRHATAWAQYGIGTSVSFLTDVTTELPHMEARWLSSVRTYLCTLSCRIEMDKQYIPNIERIHDHHIMDMVIQSQQFIPKDIRLINYCRMYLQAVTLSDITDVTGKNLDNTMLLGTRSRLSSHTKWHHFNQQRPSANAWKTWRRANLLWANAHGHLLKPLGQWLQDPKEQRRSWHAYTDSNNTLYVKSVFHTPLEYNVYYPTATTSTEYSYYTTVEQDRITELSSDSYPTFAQDCQQGTWRVQRGSHTRIQSTIMLPTTRLVSGASYTNLDFQAYIHTMAPWESDLLQFLQFQTDVFTTIGKMMSGFSAASDGSVRYHTNGSFGWIIATTEGERLVQAYGPARGYRPTSYRAEGYGLLSVLRFITRIQEYCQISAETTLGQWTVTSDNSSLVEVINRIADVSKPVELHDWTHWDMDQADIDEGDKIMTNSFDNGHPNSTLEPDWDVLHEIKWTFHKQLKGGTLIHTKGHQDDKHKYDKLPLLAQLNVDADRLAGQYQDRYGAGPSHCALVSTLRGSSPFPRGYYHITTSLHTQII